MQDVALRRSQYYGYAGMTNPHYQSMFAAQANGVDMAWSRPARAANERLHAYAEEIRHTSKQIVRSGSGHIACWKPSTGARAESTRAKEISPLAKSGRTSTPSSGQTQRQASCTVADLTEFLAPQFFAEQYQLYRTYNSPLCAAAKTPLPSYGLQVDLPVIGSPFGVAQQVDTFGAWFPSTAYPLGAGFTFVNNGQVL